MHNPYYNKSTMNLKQLVRDLEKQGFTCKLSENGDYLYVFYLCFFDSVVITLSPDKEWSVTYYKPFKEVNLYKAAANWEVIKLLNKFLVEV